MKIFSLKRFISLTALLALIALSLSALPLNAQQAEEREGVGISPTKLTLEGDPGETLTGNFKVLNTGTKPVTFSAYVKDFSVTNEEYDKVFEPIPGAVSPVGWIDIAKQDGELEPNAQAEIGYTISIPEDAVPRGYYAVIFAETDVPEPDASGVARVKRVGSLVYLTVKGGEQAKGSVASFEADTWQRDRPITANLRIQNDGNVHFESKASFQLKDIFGRTVSSTDITGSVLPATTRKFDVNLKLSQPFGIYRIQGSVNFLGNDTELPSRWVVAGSPFWIILWTLIIIAWLIVLIRWVVRRVKRKRR